MNTCKITGHRTGNWKRDSNQKGGWKNYSSADYSIFCYYLVSLTNQQSSLIMIHLHQTTVIANRERHPQGVK